MLTSIISPFHYFNRPEDSQDEWRNLFIIIIFIFFS